MRKLSKDEKVYFNSNKIYVCNVYASEFAKLQLIDINPTYSYGFVSITHSNRYWTPRCDRGLPAQEALEYYLKANWDILEFDNALDFACWFHEVMKQKAEKK